MTTATVERQAEHQDIYQAIDRLSETALEKLYSYLAFLRYEDRMEELEEQEDIAYIEAHKDEGPNIPFEEIVKEFEAEYGPLD
jgi:hypothetical protein